MEHNIQYSFAQHNLSKKPIHISEVVKTNKNNLTCPDCKEILIAVLKHKTPHFRHKPHSDCATNPESQIHWLSKEVFKEMKHIHFPPITMDDISFHHYQKLNDLINPIIKTQVPHEIQRNFIDSLKSNLIDSQSLKIQKVELEKSYKTSLGDVRIDIVLTINNQPLFIEPHYTNPISDEKFNKLMELNIPTISISLKPFIEKNPTGYTINKLKRHLQSPSTKEWSYFRPSSIDNHLNNYVKYVQSQIQKQKENFQLLDKLDLILNENQSKINYLEDYQNAIKYQKNVIIKYPTRYHKKLSLIQKFTK